MEQSSIKNHNSRIYNEGDEIWRHKSRGKPSEGRHASSVSRWGAEKSTGLVSGGKQQSLFGKHFADLESYDLWPMAQELHEINKRTATR